MADSRPGFLLAANWPSDVGFAWWLMESYWAAIAERYHDRFRMVLAFPEVNDVPDVIRDAPIEYIEQTFGPRRDVSAASDLAFLREHDITALYLTDRPMVNARYAAYRRAGVRTIVSHDHTPGERTAPTGPKRWLKWARARVPGYAVDAGIGATEYVRERIHRTTCLPWSKCFAAPNGLRPAGPPTLEDPRALASLPKDAVLMVMTARANPYKGIRFLISSLARYRAREDAANLHFMLLGDGPSLEDFKQHADAEGVADACHWPGYTTNVAGILPGCDFAIHPSQGEVGYSLAILEYMRAGLATIVPDNPTVSGATRHEQTGIVFRERDESACAQAMATLAENAELRRDWGAAAREHERQFSLDEAHRRLIEAIDTTLARR